MSRILCLPVGLLLILATGCGSEPDPSDEPAASPETPTPPKPAAASELDAQVLGLFGGEAGWKPLAEPKRVEAFRVQPSWMEGEPDPDPDPEAKEKPKFAGHPILSGPVEVDEETATKLTNILADEKAYAWDPAKSCEFVPGVGIRFVGAESTTELLFCFSCDELQIQHDGKRVGHEDTDVIRTALVRIAQQIFPDDKVVQGLKTAEQQAKIDADERRARNAQIRLWGSLMPKAAVEALTRHDSEKFEQALKKGLPQTDDQIRALLHFEGGRNGSWSSHAGVEIDVEALLKSYSKEDLAGPVREELLGEDRMTRRGAARLWQSWRSPLEDWSTDDLDRMRSICLTVMQEARYYPTRQSALVRLERWHAGLTPDEVEQRLRTGLRDPHPSVRRSAMLAAGRLGHEFAVPYLLKQLRNEKVETEPLPDVPPKEQSDVPSGFDNVAGERSEAEVAALALGYLGHAAAVALIEQKQPASPMYEVALALLGQLDRLKPEHFHIGERNKELQLAAVDAVVRARGRRGLDLVLNYKQATHWWEEERVVERVTTMLLAEEAPGAALLKNCSNLKQLAAWHAQHGAEYLQRFKPAG